MTSFLQVDKGRRLIASLVCLRYCLILKDNIFTEAFCEKILGKLCMQLCLLKGIWNEIVGLKETILYERTFEVTKIGLYSCRVSHISLGLFDM